MHVFVSFGTTNDFVVLCWCGGTDQDRLETENDKFQNATKWYSSCTAIEIRTMAGDNIMKIFANSIFYKKGSAGIAMLLFTFLVF